MRRVPPSPRCARRGAWFASLLHAPFADRGVLDAAEDDALDEEADDDDGEKAGDVGGLELVAVLEDEPAQAARARAHPVVDLWHSQSVLAAAPSAKSMLRALSFIDLPSAHTAFHHQGVPDDHHVGRSAGGFR